MLLRVTSGATKIWCYAPGYFEENRLSLDAMRELTGFTLKLVSPNTARASATETGKRLGLRQAFGGDQSVKPLFAAEDAGGDEVLATYPGGSAAVAMRRRAGGLSCFVGAPGLTSELLRVAARQAGVHLWTETDCNVYANGRFVALHASQAGPVVLNVGQAGPVTDLLTGVQVGIGPQLSLPLQRGETRVLGY